MTKLKLSDDDTPSPELQECFDRQRAYAMSPEGVYTLIIENRRMQEALARIASDHKESPQFPTGHIWSPDCDACKRQEIAREELVREALKGEKR